MRLFVAVLLPEGVVSELLRLQGELRRRWPELKCAKPEQLHITVKFLGEVAAEDLEIVQAGLEEAAEASRTFECQLANPSCLPEKGKPRIVMIKVHEPTGTLCSCAARLNQYYSCIGIPIEDRQFNPHITLIRLKDRPPENLSAAISQLAFNGVSFPVFSLSLMQSVLKPQGAQYTLVSAHKLGVHK